MIGEKVRIVVEEGSKGYTGKIVKADHNHNMYGIRMSHEGDNASLWWFSRHEFEVIG